MIDHIETKVTIKVVKEKVVRDHIMEATGNKNNMESMTSMISMMIEMEESEEVIEGEVEIKEIAIEGDMKKHNKCLKLKKNKQKKLRKNTALLLFQKENLHFKILRKLMHLKSQKLLVLVVGEKNTGQLSILESNPPIILVILVQVIIHINNQIIIKPIRHQIKTCQNTTNKNKMLHKGK